MLGTRSNHFLCVGYTIDLLWFGKVLYPMNEHDMVQWRTLVDAMMNRQIS